MADMLPDWMQTLRDTQEQETASRRSLDLQREYDQLRLRHEGPAFWTAFAQSMDYSVGKSRDAFPALQTASWDDIGQPEYRNFGYRLTLSPPLQVLDIRYTSGDRFI